MPLGASSISPTGGEWPIVGFLVLGAGVVIIATGSPDNVVTAAIARCGCRPLGHHVMCVSVMPFSISDAVIDRSIVARTVDRCVFRRAAAMADTKTLSKVVFAAMAIGGTVAIIARINVSQFISLRLAWEVVAGIGTDDDLISYAPNSALRAANADLARRIEEQIGGIGKEWQHRHAILRLNLSESHRDHIFYDAIAHLLNAGSYHLRPSVASTLLGSRCTRRLRMLSVNGDSVDPQ